MASRRMEPSCSSVGDAVSVPWEASSFPYRGEIGGTSAGSRCHEVVEVLAAASTCSLSFGGWGQPPLQWLRVGGQLTRILSERGWLGCCQGNIGQPPMPRIVGRLCQTAVI